jgi:hypothetical protein
MFPYFPFSLIEIMGIIYLFFFFAPAQPGAGGAFVFGPLARGIVMPRASNKIYFK